MKCLDTDFLVAFLRKNESLLPALKRLEYEKLVTTSLTAFELLEGARLSASKEENMTATMRILKCIEVLPLDLHAANIASEIDVDLIRQGKQIGLKDVFIGAISLANNCPLITRNVKHFSKIKSLKVEEW